MRTIQQIKKEIQEIKDRIENEELKKATENKLRKQIKFLNQCILYIETNPPETFITAEVKRIQQKIKLRIDSFPAGKYKSWAGRDVAKAKRDFEKMYEVPKLRTQLKTLKFLLAA